MTNVFIKSHHPISNSRAAYPSFCFIFPPLPSSDILFYLFAGLSPVPVSHIPHSPVEYKCYERRGFCLLFTTIFWVSRTVTGTEHSIRMLTVKYTTQSTWKPFRFRQHKLGLKFPKGQYFKFFLAHLLNRGGKYGRIYWGGSSRKGQDWGYNMK